MESYWEHYEQTAAFKDPYSEGVDSFKGKEKETSPSEDLLEEIRDHIDGCQERMKTVIWDIILDNLERTRDHEHHKTIELFVHTIRGEISRVRKI